ncbi:pathogenesis-related leaf protein 6-like [Telopea speciosissima]|uniref:pathogenesis-related leaf protein 6-like n=1 Tax=Telopea speciosissima TaxID=54955 RepID=UPI001CC82CC2|nr:pathogenesis-related leaf protein 6-like [Telopea speciosissima]
MGSYKLDLLALLCSLIGLTFFFQVYQAQNSPQDFLAAHNAARADVGVGPMTWDDILASYAGNYAQERARDCNLVHSTALPASGENIAWSSGNMSAAEAVELWVSEKEYYDYNNNSCIEGQLCRHYIQVVWSKSLRLGCGRAQCNNGGTFFICNYYPHGNYIGERPYMREPSACFHINLYM